MKKTVAALLLIFAVSAAFFAPACKQNATGGAKEVLKSTDEIYSYLMANGNFAEMRPNVGREDLFELYGIDSSKIESYEFRFSEERLNAEEIAVFKVSDAEYENILIGILTSQIAGAARQAVGYNTKERCEMIENTKVYSKGAYVFYVMNREGEELSKKLMELIPEN